MITALKNCVKRSQGLSQLYYILSLLPDIPLKDFTKLRQLKLLFSVKPYSALSYARLAKIYELANELGTLGIKGNCVECGVWNGGSAAIIAELTKAESQRHLWLFDSWEGLPEPGTFDVSPSGEQGEQGSSFGYQENVEALLFQKLGLERQNIELVKGWFHDTIPAKIPAIGEIALLHLDCDWYKSIAFCLDTLYDSVVDGGFVVIDDYGYWKGCKKAVDEFFERKRLHITLVWIDKVGVYFQKPLSGKNNLKEESDL